jgi:hypothetical protein
VDILHKNEGFLAFDVDSELPQPKHIKTDVLKNLICRLIKSEYLFYGSFCAGSCA